MPEGLLESGSRPAAGGRGPDSVHRRVGLAAAHGVAARLAQWPPLARLEARIRGASPRWALAFFLFPAVLLFPIKLVALWLMHLGQTALGVLLIVAAKLLGTAFVGRCSS